MHIEKAKLFKPYNYMNKNMEIFGACKYKAKTHRCEKCMPINA